MHYRNQLVCYYNNKSNTTEEKKNPPEHIHEYMHDTECKLLASQSTH